MASPTSYDVIVVGAGPAGSTTAREVAQRGFSVLLLDRAAFPRDKPCGGGVTVRAARLLPFDLFSVTERVIYGTSITVGDGRPLQSVSSQPITYLTQRRHLDSFLLERARHTDVEVREGTEVRAIERHDQGVRVQTSAGIFNGRALVAADGVNGRTAKLAGVPTDRRLTVALEGNITPPGGVPAVWDHLIGLAAGDPPGGYGWIFPKGDHLNIGVATLPRWGSTLRPRLHALTQTYGLDPGDLWAVRGHHLPIRRASSPLVGDRVLLVGDAAGLVDPFSLEGIHSAIWSGQAAARHLTAFLSGETGSLFGYQKEIDRELQPDLDVARQIYELSWLVGWRTWMLAARYLPPASSVLWRLMRGDQTYTGVKRKLGPAHHALDLASRAMQSIPSLRGRVYD